MAAVPWERAGRALLLALLTAAANAARAHAEVPLASVGQLLIPTTRQEQGYRRHFDERCSATLVAPDRRGLSRWALTAWHCLEYYRDLSRPIVFVHASGRRTTARARSSGGTMSADWALLQLAEAFPHAVRLFSADAPVGTSLVMAGYSRAPGTAAPPLAADRSCRVTERAGADLVSDCHARRGASGGAVFSAEGPHRYLGIISRGDSDSVSIFVPLARLATQLRPFLEIHQPGAAEPPPR